jgi:hypothetical protein
MLHTQYDADFPKVHLRRDVDSHNESITRRGTNDSDKSYDAHVTEQQHITSVAHVAFTDALLAQKPKPFTKTMFKLYFFLFVAFLNSCINGYNSSLMGGINAMQSYQSYVPRSFSISDGIWG